MIKKEMLFQNKLKTVSFFNETVFLCLFFSHEFTNYCKTILMSPSAKSKGTPIGTWASTSLSLTKSLEFGIFFKFLFPNNFNSTSYFISGTIYNGNIMNSCCWRNGQFMKRFGCCFIHIINIPE